MNSNGQQAMIAVQEERARIGGIEVAKKTVIAATDEGVIAFQINTVEASGPPQQRPALPGYPMAALPASSPSPIVVSTESDGSCVDCCCACDSGYEWYELKGKGFCCILLLLLFYLVVGAIFLPLAIAACICACLCDSGSND
ncbi:uncharacterized protein LOC110065794 [Orbicella faveolata]|uniref:uncharacterized protein LOC110065794 n=1 Tax=Orbicella faveolata TaxID=48498 RepID=UPI0009E39485|nr:uncharacterized protein LOC110065794 [Orbicella faveolata]